MTVSGQEGGGELFGEEVDPVSFALSGADALYERALSARQNFERHLASQAQSPTYNILALSARHQMAAPLGRLVELATLTRGLAAALRHAPEDKLDEAFAAFYAAYGDANRAMAQVEHLERFLLTPDQPPRPPPDDTLPVTHDWQTVVTRVQNDTSAWCSSVRGKKGRVLILKPSPGTGKTRAMIQTAIDEQGQGQRVVIAVRTKQMLTDELEPRIRNSGNGPIRLHVIQGRDDSTCWNFENVKVVQEHGYAPGSAVCSRCDFHPDAARRARSYTVCPYYRSRQQAESAYLAARWGLHEYPLILTTHSGYLTAIETGGGRFGKFWPCDLLMIDEDPTASFEPAVILEPDHLQLPGSAAKPDDRAAHVLAGMLRAAIAAADADRRTAMGRGWKNEAGEPDKVHARHGSSYAGLALHRLLERVGGKSFVQILRDASDSHVHPSAGALHGATTAAAANMIIPPRSLSLIADAIFEELSLRMSLRRHAFKKIHEQDVSDPFGPGALIARDQLEAAMAESAEFDAVYRVHLDYYKGSWRFVFQNAANMLDQGANIIIGDAYAHVGHYRQLLSKPETDPSDPSYVDPVTVIEHIARFPEGSLVCRVRTRSTITYLNTEGWTEHAGILAEVLRNYAGLSVLLYGHGELRDRVSKLMSDNDDFGIARWAFENWGGGRGKDQYGNWDAVVTVSDYIQNLDSTVHVANARAFRDAQRAVALNSLDTALAEGRRIRMLRADSRVTHAMTHDGTHWRIVQEHERQNVSEQAQALHRVRGFRSPKRMVVVGDGIEFTKDTLAAAVTAVPAERPNSGTLRDMSYDGFLSEEECYMAIRAIEEHFGCWSPAFMHAFWALELGELLNGTSRIELPVSNAGVTACQVVDEPNEIQRIQLGLSTTNQLLDSETARHTITTSPVPGPCGTNRLSLMQRVWFPPADWQNLSRSAQHGMRRAINAHKRATIEFKTKGRLFPVWNPRARGTQGYQWYSTRGFAEGFRAFAEIMNHQYGPVRDGVLHAPNQKSFVPF